MSSIMPLRSWLAVVAAVSAPGFWITGPGPAAAQSVHQRPASITAVIGKSRGKYDGAFTANGVASICGEIPKEASMTGLAAFIVEYPYDDPQSAAVQSISFGSNLLVGIDTLANKFRLNVHVRKPDGSKPVAYVLHTDPVTPKNTGTATLTRLKGTVILRVIGENDVGEVIDLMVTCK